MLVRPEYGVALALALAPLTNVTVATGTTGEFKPLQLLLPALAFGLVAYGVLVAPSTADIRRAPWLTVAVVCFAAVAVASSAQAIEPAVSVKKMVIILTAAAIFFAVLQICHRREQLLVVVGGAVAGLLVASAQGVVERYQGKFSSQGFVANGEIVHRVEGSFGHPNQYGGYLAVLIPIAVALLLSRRFPAIYRWLGGAALAFAVPALVFSYVRGAIIALVLGSLAWLAFLRPRLAAGIAVLVAVAAVVLVPATLKERFSGSTASGGDVALRKDLWNSAIDIYSVHPYLGAGLNNFSKAYAGLPAIQDNATQRRLLHNEQIIVPPHAANLYLNILAEEGTIGFLAFLAFALAAVQVAYRGARARDPAARTISLAVGASLLTLGIHSILEVTLLSELVLPLFALLAVTAVYVSLEREPEPEPTRSS